MLDIEEDLVGDLWAFSGMRSLPHEQESCGQNDHERDHDPLDVRHASLQTTGDSKKIAHLSGADEKQPRDVVIVGDVSQNAVQCGRRPAKPFVGDKNLNRSFYNS